MPQVIRLNERRTSADLVFDHLYDEIVSLRLMPGARISEAEIAARFGVSRQPVRDAFNRLSNIDLLLVRPQKATEVRRFSRQAIATARFVRLAVELEVVHRAAAVWDDGRTAAFARALEDQAQAVARNDRAAFHRLDYAFHERLCAAAERGFAAPIIAQNKAQIDRLCVLSLKTQDSMRALVEDHAALVRLLTARDGAGAAAMLRLHLSRLDATLDQIYRDHTGYFED